MKRGFLLDGRSKRKSKEGLLRDSRSRDDWNSWGFHLSGGGDTRLGSAQGSWSLPVQRRPADSATESRNRNANHHVGQMVASVPSSSQPESTSLPSHNSSSQPVHEIELVCKAEHSMATTAPMSSVSESSMAAEYTRNALQFQGITEFLPHKTVGVPRAALAAWYGQKPRCHQVTKENYISWNDGGMSHNQRFTSVFVCPLTGEVFASGKYGRAEKHEVRYHDAETGRQIRIPDDQNDVPESAILVVWYKQKTLAEHGAAARAYDCFSFRRTNSTLHCLGLSIPYRREDRPPLPPLSPDVEDMVKKRKEQVQARMEIEEAVETIVRQKHREQQEIEDDLQRERNEYRTARVVSQIKDISIHDASVAESTRIDSSLQDEAMASNSEGE